MIFLFFSSDNLWDLAISEVQKKEDAEDDSAETERSVFFIGNKNGVKCSNSYCLYLSLLFFS